MKKQTLSLRQISSDEISDPLENFYSGIKAEETKIAYVKTLKEFFSIIEDFDGTFEQKAMQFTKFAKHNPENTKNLLKNYAKMLRKRTEEPTTSTNYLNPNTLPNKFKGIKKFLKMNEIPVEWSGIEAIFPEKNNVKQTRGYTTEEIRKMLEYCTDSTSEFLILAESSSGIRAGSWENQTWNSIKPIYEGVDGSYTHDILKAKNQEVVCASMTVYGGTSSMYMTLISIEAWDKLRLVKERWINKMGRNPKPDDLIILPRFNDKRTYAKNGVKNKVSQIIQRSKVQKPLVAGQRNHEVPLTHGLRKRWNKIMSEQKITNDSYGNLIRKEWLFGHRSGVTKLDQSYFFNKVEEAVPQYLAAMPELMITEQYKKKAEFIEITNQNKKLKEKLKEKDNALSIVEELQAKVERLEKYEKL